MKKFVRSDFAAPHQKSIKETFNLIEDAIREKRADYIQTKEQFGEAHKDVLIPYGIQQLMEAGAVKYVVRDNFIQECCLLELEDKGTVLLVPPGCSYKEFRSMFDELTAE